MIFIKVLLDADSSPVMGIVESLCMEFHVKLVVVKNYNHNIKSNYAEIITVDSVKEAADLKIMNLTEKNDIVISQDYGLAAMVLGKGAYVINQYGKIINNENIDFLLDQRYLNKKIQTQYRVYPKFKKRNREDDLNFKNNLLSLLERLAF